MYFATKWSWSFTDDGTHDYGSHASGYARSRLVGRDTGAVHTEPRAGPPRRRWPARASISTPSNSAPTCWAGGRW